MANPGLRHQARQLRKKGKSIYEIAELITAPVSTISYWCRDISLTSSQQSRLFKKQTDPSYPARLHAAEQIRHRRIERSELLRNSGVRDIGKMNDREIFFTGIGLYWGEGFRKQEKVGFTSGDENIVVFMLQWLRLVFKVTPKDLILRVTINEAHKHRSKEICAHWSRLTHVRPEQFTKPSYVATKQITPYQSEKPYFGTLRVLVRKSTDKHRMLMGWLEGVRQRGQSNSS